MTAGTNSGGPEESGGGPEESQPSCPWFDCLLARWEHFFFL